MDKVNKGWVKLHRTVFENHFLMHDETCFALFMKLLLTVGKGKGEISGGRRDLAEKYNMGEYVFYRAMKRLEREQIVHITSHKLYTTYTIRNWHKYQSTGAQTSAQLAHNTRTTPAHLYKNKEIRIKKSDLIFNELPEQPERASRDTVRKIKEQLAEKGIIKRRSMA